MIKFAKALLWCVVVLIGINSTAGAAEFAVVSKRTIYPGQIIDAIDLKSVELIRKPLIKYKFVTQPQQLIGLQAKRTILPGRFIRVGSAEMAPLVKAGSLNRVQFRSGVLAISLVCVALTDAAAGDAVRMRNPTSGKIFTAQVQEDGTIITGAL